MHQVDSIFLTVNNLLLMSYCVNRVLILLTLG